MAHYKSWAGLRKQLEALLCDPLKGGAGIFTAAGWAGITK